MPNYHRSLISIHQRSSQLHGPLTPQRSSMERRRPNGNGDNTAGAAPPTILCGQLESAVIHEVVQRSAAEELDIGPISHASCPLAEVCPCAHAHITPG